MSSPAPDSGPNWTDAESRPGSTHRAPAQAGGVGRHRAPGAHRARSGASRTAEPRPIVDQDRTAEHGQHRISGGPPVDGTAAPSLVRSSSVMALGTLASRVTGLLRTLVLVPAIGQEALANSYNYANTLPNTVYNLAIGGILTSVIVPLLVNAAKRDSDRGEKYDQRLFTLVTAFLFVITLVATLVAAPIAHLYDPNPGYPRAGHVLVIFAYFFVPQIFFYGVTSLAGAILNARGHFAAPMWTPVVNNVVVIAVTVMFMVFAGTHQSAHTITPFEMTFLGLGTTLGIVAQTVALIPALRRVGFRWRPRFDFKREDVSEIGRMSGWMFCYVLTTQVAYLVTAIVLSYAEKSKQAQAVGAGYSAYSYAWLLFQLPYAVIAISVITALLPRMSANAADRRYDLVRSDFSSGVRLGSVIVAPAALVLAVLGPSLSELLLSYGNNNVAHARYLGLVFAVFSVGLMPYMLFQLLLRVFYALHDSKTPALIGVAVMVTNAGANLLAAAIFTPTVRVAALGACFGLSNLVGTVIAWRVLSARLGGLDGREIGRSLVRMHVAALPAAIFALVVAIAMTAALSTARSGAFLIVVVGGAGALLCYLGAARAMRLAEVTDLTRMVRSRLRR
ncbi:MAG TPA: murein biosynthesis integral membrane protein MurJ [Streptosporangiaceae bacterium]|nr:murein biosynthesis integral membrane protein MurJ [Streptosporangiaceae bacterium]